MTYKNGGVIKLTYEYLADIFGIPEATIQEVWSDQSSDCIYIKYHNAEDKYGIKFNNKIVEGEVYPYVILTSDYFDKLQESRKDISRSYSGFSNVDIHAVRHYDSRSDIDIKLRACACNYTINRKYKDAPRIISGTFISEDPKSNFPDIFDIVMTTTNEEGKKMILELLKVEPYKYDGMLYYYTAKEIIPWSEND